MNMPGMLPSVIISFPNTLRTRVGQRASVEAKGRTVREVIAALDQDFSGVRFNLCHETGELRPYVNIFLDGENIRYLQGLDTQLSNGAKLLILQSVAGG